MKENQEKNTPILIIPKFKKSILGEIKLANDKLKQFELTLTRLYYESMGLNIDDYVTLQKSLSDSQEELIKNNSVSLSLKETLEKIRPENLTLYKADKRLGQCEALNQPDFWQNAKKNIESNTKDPFLKQRLITQLAILQRNWQANALFAPFLEKGLVELMDRWFFDFKRWATHFQLDLNETIDAKDIDSQNRLHRSYQETLSHVQLLKKWANNHQEILKKQVVERLLPKPFVLSSSVARRDDIVTYTVEQLIHLKALNKQQQQGAIWQAIDTKSIRPNAYDKLRLYQLAGQYCSNHSIQVLGELMDKNKFTYLAKENCLVPVSIAALLKPKFFLFDWIDKLIGWGRYAFIPSLRQKLPLLLTYSEWLNRDVKSLAISGLENSLWLTQFQNTTKHLTNEAKVTAKQLAKQTWFTARVEKNLTQKWYDCVDEYQCKLIQQGFLGLEHMIEQLDKNETLNTSSITAVNQLYATLRTLITDPAYQTKHQLNDTRREYLATLKNHQSQLLKKINQCELFKRWQEQSNVLNQHLKKLSTTFELGRTEWDALKKCALTAKALDNDYWQQLIVLPIVKRIDKLILSVNGYLGRSYKENVDDTSKMILMELKIKSIIKELSDSCYYKVFDEKINHLSSSLTQLGHIRLLAGLPNTAISAKQICDSLAIHLNSKRPLKQEDKRFLIDNVLLQLAAIPMNSYIEATTKWGKIADIIRKHGSKLQAESLKTTTDKMLGHYCANTVRKADGSTQLSENLGDMITSIGNKEQKSYLIQISQATNVKIQVEKAKAVYFLLYSKYCAQLVQTQGVDSFRQEIDKKLMLKGLSVEQRQLFFNKHDQSSTLQLSQEEQKQVNWQSDIISSYWSCLTEVQRYVREISNISETSKISKINVWVKIQLIQKVCEDYQLTGCFELPHPLVGNPVEHRKAIDNQIIKEFKYNKQNSSTTLISNKERSQRTTENMRVLLMFAEGIEKAVDKSFSQPQNKRYIKNH